MKYSKRYVVFTLILIIIFVSDFYIFAKDNTTLGEFRGAEIESTVWSPLVAKDVNKNTIHMMIDNKEYTSDTLKFYMDDDRNIMVPVDMLREALNCSARIYQENELWVEKHSLMADYMLGTDNDFILYDGKFYVSMNSLSEMLDCTCTFDTDTNTLTVVDNSEGISDVPPSYDLRTRLRVSEVRNQGTYGTCWAFAAISALESSLMPEENLLFSVDHMSMSNSFNVNQYDGGEYTMGMAYLAAWKGPVFEVDDPYGDGKTDESLTAVKHVQEMQVIDGKDYEKIKEAVFKYGGVQTSIYNALKSSQARSPYYNRATSAYCYIGTEKPNHDVVIVGWDDSYSKDNFSMDLEGDGAFICQNSWGSEFGEDGFFYISYYDTNVGTHNVVYTGIENTGNYDHIYQSDLCGWVGQLGYNKETIYGANVYTAGSDENLVAASFYATGKDSEYQLYLVKNFENVESLSSMKPVASGKLSNAGYYTIPFEQEMAVEAGERYAVVLYISTPGAVHPLAVEYKADESTENVVLDDGEGYVSPNGFEWEDVKNIEDSNICLKVFSKNQ